MAEISSIMKPVTVPTMVIRFELCEQNHKLLLRIRDRSTKVDAIMVLRLMLPGIDLMEAKEIIDKM